MSSICNVLGNALKPEHAMKTRKIRIKLKIELVCLFISMVFLVF